jgi:hypothetical protein
MQIRCKGLLLFLCLAFALAFNSCGGGGGGGGKETTQNPIPSINSLTPTSGIAGNASLTITINGSGFIAGSIARWNGSNRTTTFVGNTKLTALISASDIAAAGTARVLVFNPTPGGGASSAVVFPINNPVPTVSSVNPSNKVVGGPSFALTVNGSNFLPSSEVRWNGSSRATTFVGSMQLTALISASDIVALGTAQVLVYNPVPGGGVSNAAILSINNPVPAISSLSPTNNPVGAPEFTLSVNGSGFLPSSMIRWKGTVRITTFVSSAQLTAAIPADELVSPGTASVVVNNPSPGGGASNSIDFVISLYPYNWTYLGFPTVDGKSYANTLQIVIDPEDHRILYVDVNDRGLFISRDGGNSWIYAVKENILGYGVIALDPSDANRLFYAKSTNLYVTNNRGISWNLVATLDPSTYVASLVVSKLDPHTIYVGTCGSRFYRSMDDGVTWQSFLYGPSVGTHNFKPYTLAEDPIEGILYAGGEFGEAHPHPSEPFLRSLDGGATWEDVAPRDANGQSTMGIAASSAINPTSHKLYVLPEGNVVHTSIDRGLTWKRATNWYLHAALLRDANQDKRFFGGLHNNGLNANGGAFVSADDAELFYHFGLEGISVSYLALSGDSQYLFASGYTYGIYVTTLPPPSSPEQ